MEISRTTAGNCNIAQKSDTVFLCHSEYDKELANILTRELRRRSYTPFSDTVVSSREVKVYRSGTATSDGRIYGILKSIATCRLGLILWSEDFFRYFSDDTMLHLETLAGHNVPVLHLLYKLTLSDLKDPERRILWRQPWTNDWTAQDIYIKKSKWISTLDSLTATNILDYDKMATNVADYASLVADKVAHIMILDIHPSNEQVQGKEDLCQELKDMYTPNIQRDYPVSMGECKLVTVRVSPEESCDEFASILAAELKKMSYNAIIIGLDCSGSQKDRIWLHSSLMLFVLSDSFFRNEACLIDVIKNAQVPMLSLFYKLSMSEFKDEKRRELWRKEWRCWKERHENTANWEQAVEILGSCDGINYSMKASNIMQYLQVVAEAVCRRVPLQVFWTEESSQVQGKIEMCEKVDALFQSKASLINGGTQVLGVHGIWGVGKSTLGKALCDFYSPEFGGRVCYVELAVPSLPGSYDVQLHRRKRILQDLFEADPNFLEWRVRDLGQAHAYLDYCLGQAFKKVFLVVDNIQNSLQSFEEARDLFMRKIPFPRGSKVLLLARTPHTLRGLLQPLESLSDSVVEFPSRILCTVHDQIFRQALESGLSESAVETLYKGCDKNDIFQYFFPEFCRSCHPLTIKSLAAFAQSRGSSFGDLANPEDSGQPPYPITGQHNVRIDHLVKEGLLDYVFETLQKSYKLFDSKEQQFFLDVALCMPSTNIHRLRRLHDSSEELFSTTSKYLRKLRDEAFLTFMGREVQMPAVCRYFAEKMVQRDWSAQMMLIARESVQWACVRDNVLKARNLDSLQRIVLESCHFVQGNDLYDCFTLDLSSCEHLSVLRLWENMSEKRIEVRLGKHNILKSLEVLYNMCPISITVTGNFPECLCFKGDYSIIMAPRGLSYPDLDVRLLGRLQVLEIFMPTDMSNLRHLVQWINPDVLQIHGQVSYGLCASGYISRSGTWRSLDEFIDLSRWISLRELVLEDVVELLELRGLNQLCNLRVLHLGGLDDLIFLEGIEKLGKLEEFHLLDCSSLYKIELPGSSRLKHCCICRCEKLCKIQVTKAAGQSGDNDEEQEEEDEGVEEENRWWLQYDADMWRGSTNGSLRFNPDSHVYCVHKQDRCRHCFRYDTPRGWSDLVPMLNSGDQYVHKFKVCECPLLSAYGLLDLTSIHVFEFSQGNRFGLDLWWLMIGQGLFTASHVSSLFEYQIDLDGRISGFMFERGTGPWTAQVLLLEVVAVDNKWLLGELMKLLQSAVGLKKLSIECVNSEDLSMCGCDVLPPRFFLLSQSVRELKYGCPHVCDLSSMDRLVQLTSLDLEGCKNVKMWPDFSKMSSLSALNLRNTSWKGSHPFSKVVTSPM